MGIWLVFVPATSSAVFFSRETHSPVCYHLLPPSRNIRAFFLHHTSAKNAIILWEGGSILFSLIHQVRLIGVALEATIPQHRPPCPQGRPTNPSTVSRSRSFVLSTEPSLWVRWVAIDTNEHTMEVNRHAQPNTTHHITTCLKSGLLVVYMILRNASY